MKSRYEEKLSNLINLEQRIINKDWKNYCKNFLFNYYYNKFIFII